MSASGSFGVNYKKVWDGVTIPLPAKVTDIGSDTNGEFMFVQADGAIDQYAFVVISAAGQADMLTTTTATSSNKLVGIAQVAALDNEYLWVFIGGVAGAGTGSGIKGKYINYTALANTNTTATDGVADDASTTLVKNVVGLTTVAGTATAVEVATTGVMVVN